MRKLLCISILPFLLVFFSGCSSTKIIAKQELIDAQKHHNAVLSKISVGVLQVKDTQGNYQFEEFVKNLTQTKVFKRVEVITEKDKWPDLLISNIQDSAPPIGRGFQCFEPYLLVFTVGVIPQTCNRDHTLSFDVSLNEVEPIVKIEEHYKEKSATGWAAKALTPSESNMFSGSKVEYILAVFNLYSSQIEALIETKKSALTTHSSGTTNGAP